MLLSTPSLTCICPCCSVLYSQAAEAAELATRVQAEAADMAMQQAEELRLKAVRGVGHSRRLDRAASLRLLLVCCGPLDQERCGSKWLASIPSKYRRGWPAKAKRARGSRGP